jgi:hypothetical protein
MATPTIRPYQNRKNVILPTKIIDAGTMTGTTTLTSDVVDTQYIDNVGIHFVWTGTAVGTFTVEGSTDGTTYRALDFGATLSASGSASDHLLSIQSFPFCYLRAKYVNASSTGTLNCFVTGKEL